VTAKTIIVGGGLAGLAAAAALAERGVQVKLLESRPRLGGRAGSFVDAQTQTQIDNCQHVSMGCCTNFNHFCSTTGLAESFREERELYFIGPDGETNRFAASALPAPLHLWSAFRGLRYLNNRDRRQLAKGLRALARSVEQSSAEESFDAWLQRHDQTPAAIERFWNVVLVSALSETLDRIDVWHARKVFVDAFLANRDGWKVRIPTVPLDELYGGRLTEWLTRRGAEIRILAGVEALVIEDNRIANVVLRNGEALSGDHFIVAVPHDRLLSLLPESLAAHRQFEGCQRLESAPISSVHLWFDRPITALPHAVPVCRLSQWVFNRSLLQSVHQAPRADKTGNSSSSWYYQVVISASRELRDMSSDEAIARVVAELTEIWPEAAQAQVVHSRLVTEHKAVFSVLPGVEALRPEQQSPIGNLQIAGDWTKTGWPGTMESAVRSGYLAAENVLRRLGRFESVLQPDLPVARLSRFLLGL
jgi:squalene-associated FAD-dependent desaturase